RAVVVKATGPGGSACDACQSSSHPRPRADAVSRELGSRLSSRVPTECSLVNRIVGIFPDTFNRVGTVDFLTNDTIEHEVCLLKVLRTTHTTANDWVDDRLETLSSKPHHRLGH